MWDLSSHQGLKPHPLLLKAKSYPLNCQGSSRNGSYFFLISYFPKSASEYLWFLTHQGDRVALKTFLTLKFKEMQLVSLNELYISDFHCLNYLSCNRIINEKNQKLYWGISEKRKHTFSVSYPSLQSFIIIWFEKQVQNFV